MILKAGDYLTIDDTEYVVEHETVPNEYLCKEVQFSGTYYHLRYFTKDSLIELQSQGRLKLGKQEKLKGGNVNCFHTFERYKGIRDVYDYCIRCSAKRPVSWRDLK